MRKLLLTLALLLGLAAPAATAQAAPAPQHHLYYNAVAFASGGICPPTNSSCFINLDATGDAWNPTASIWPGEISFIDRSMQNVDCFRPSVTLYSYWNGVYSAGAIRCFVTSGNTLTLYAWRH